MADKENILIPITGPFTGLWLSVAKILSSDYNVNILCKDHTSKKRISGIIPDVNVYVEAEDELRCKIVENKYDIVKESLVREKKYGETFSLLISSNRALGKGYIFNADKYPDQGKTWWPFKKKLKEILIEYIYWEYIVDKYSPVLILGHEHIPILSVVSRYNRIKYLCVVKARFSNRYMWTENKYAENSELTERVVNNSNNLSDIVKVAGNVEFIHDHDSLHFLSTISYDFKTMFKKTIRLFIYESYRKIRRTYNIDSYKPYAWLSVILRSYLRYKYFLKYGEKPNDLKDYKIVYFALHKEPESSLQHWAPEFNNSMEIIAWVSKSLRADTLLVVREHPSSYGIRSKMFHDNLRRIGNVVLAHPEISSWAWIKRSKLVVSITGTVGVEAVYFGKPVITFGRHLPIRYLPTVRYADSYDKTKAATDELLSLSENNKLFEISRNAIYHAQMDVSFEMKDFFKINRSYALQMDLAKVIVEDLKKRYNL